MSKLEENTSLITALTEIEKKVGQAEIDRNTLKANLSNKGVAVSGTDKMQKLIDKTQDLHKIITKPGNSNVVSFGTPPEEKVRISEYSYTQIPSTVFKSSLEGRMTVKVVLLTESNLSSSWMMRIEARNKQNSVLGYKEFSIGGDYPTIYVQFEIDYTTNSEVYLYAKLLTGGGKGIRFKETSLTCDFIID